MVPNFFPKLWNKAQFEFWKLSSETKDRLNIKRTSEITQDPEQTYKCLKNLRNFEKREELLAL